MAEDRVQPPRYTSTPLANRKTSNILNNFFEVSPIFPTPERIKKAKSLIPVLKTDVVRPGSNGFQSTVAKKKVSTSKNSLASKINAHHARLFNQEALPPAPRAEPQSAHRNTIDQAIESVIQSLSQKETNTTPKESHIQSLSQKETKTTPKESHVGAVSAKSTVKTPVHKEVPEEKPQNCVDGVHTKNLTETKPQVPKAVSAKEPRNSIDEVIDSVIRSLSQKETKSSLRESDAQDVPQSKSGRVSKISERPSTLPSVPEEVSVAGTSQLSEACILKRSETQSGWLIPKETKTRISLKRKSSVPLTVTKRNKKIPTISKQDDESLFDSPELPNLVELSSFCNKRQTYVLKKKPEITGIQEECHESVTDGIVPLEILSQKSPLVNLSVKSTQGNSKQKLKEPITKKKDEMCEQTAPKNKLEEGNEGKEVIEQYVSPNFKVYKNNKTFVKQPENQLKECVNIESSNGKTESCIKSIDTNDTKPIESNREPSQKINIPEQRNKELGADTIACQSKDTKKKNIKSKKKETNLSQDKNTGSLKSDTERRRILRERKPNIRYVDKSEINGNETKEIDRKKKKVSTVKSSQEQKENSSETPVENKTQRKKIVKGTKKVNSVNSVPNELLLQHHSKGPKDTDGDKTLNSQKNLEMELCSEKQEKITASSKSNKKDKCTDINNEKEIENEKGTKKVAKTNPEIPVEEKEKHINHTNFHNERDSELNTSKRDEAVISTATNTKEKAQPKQQISLANDGTNQTSEANAESQSAGSFVDNERLKLVLQGKSSLKSTSNNKTKSYAFPETKNRRKTVCKTSSVKHVNDDNPSMKRAEEDVDGNSQSTKGKISEQPVEEKEKIRRKTILNKHRSKSQSRGKPKNTDVCEHTMADKSNKLPEDEKCPETESCVSSGEKRKSENMECGASHSESRFYFRERKQPPVEFWKNQTGYSRILSDKSISESALKKPKYDDSNSGNVNNAVKGFSIKDLFGMHEVNTQEIQPGVVAARSIHINNFVMMGEVCLEPGATLSKISTNTTYSVQEGTACVTIKKHTKYFNADDVHRRFFIPKNIDVSITNAGHLPLKMEFVKFRG